MSDQQETEPVFAASVALDVGVTDETVATDAPILFSGLVFLEDTKSDKVATGAVSFPAGIVPSLEDVRKALRSAIDVSNKAAAEAGHDCSMRLMSRANFLKVLGQPESQFKGPLTFLLDGSAQQN